MKPRVRVGHHVDEPATFSSGRAGSACPSVRKLSSGTGRSPPGPSGGGTTGISWPEFSTYLAVLSSAAGLEQIVAGRRRVLDFLLRRAAGVHPEWPSAGVSNSGVGQERELHVHFAEHPLDHAEIAESSLEAGNDIDLAVRLPFPPCGLSVRSSGGSPPSCCPTR